MRPSAIWPGLLHRGADHPECFLRQLAVGRQVVGVVPIDAVDVAGRDEPLDVDGLGALQLDRLDLLVGQQDVFALGDLVALDQIRPVDRPGRPGPS